MNIKYVNNINKILIINSLYYKSTQYIYYKYNLLKIKTIYYKSENIL